MKYDIVVDLNLKDQILLLLYSHKDHPIYGRTLLFKELFLFYKEMLEHNEYKLTVINPQYIPYRYGPFSFPLSSALTSLVIAKMIKVSGRAKSNVETFSLTDEGIKMAEISYNRIHENVSSEFFESLMERRIGWDQLGRSGIVRYVKIKFPEYDLKNTFIINKREKGELKELMNIKIVSIQKEYEDDKWALMFAE
jgi:hypothetical protein